MNDNHFFNGSAEQCIEVALLMSAFVPSKCAPQSALSAKNYNRQYTQDSYDLEQTDEH